MKQHDWNGHRITVLAHAYSLVKGVAVDVHLRAATEDEALDRLARKLQCRQDFLRETEGNYEVKFAREI